MTQKEKIARASGFAYSVKSIAKSLIRECRDYDETWAVAYGKDLICKADELLKAFSK